LEACAEEDCGCAGDEAVEAGWGWYSGGCGGLCGRLSEAFSGAVKEAGAEGGVKPLAT